MAKLVIITAVSGVAPSYTLTIDSTTDISVADHIADSQGKIYHITAVTAPTTIVVKGSVYPKSPESMPIIGAASVYTPTKNLQLAQLPREAVGWDEVIRRDLLTIDAWQATTANITYYVATTGDDTNDGLSVDKAFATIQKAIDSIPKRIRHLVTIRVAAGSYTGFGITGFVMDPAPGVNVHGIMMLGTYTNATLTTGTATGTFTGTITGSAAAPTFSTLVDDTQTWTVDNLKGYLVEILTGTSAGSFVPIVSNTATTLTIASTSAVGSVGGTYAIRDWASIITSPITMPGTLFQSNITPVALSYGISVRNNANGVTGSMLIEGMKVNLPTNTVAISTQGNTGIVRFERCCTMGIGAGFQSGGAATTQFFNCVIRSTNNIGGLVGNAGGSFSMGNCLISGNPGLGAGLQIQGSNTVGGVNNTRIEGHPNGIKIVTTGACIWQCGGLFIETGASQAVLMSAVGHIGWGGTIFQVTGIKADNCSSAFHVGGLNQVWCDSLQATNCTYAVIAERGARVQLGPASTMTNCANELYFDGPVVYTLANMRAANPRLIANTYGTIVFE